MKAVLHESGVTHHHKSNQISQTRLNKLMKKKLAKKAKKLKNAKFIH